MAFEVIENCKKIYTKSVVPDMGVRVVSRSMTRGAKAGGGAIAIHTGHDREKDCPFDQPNSRKPQYPSGLWHRCRCRQDPRFGRQRCRRLSQQTRQVGQLLSDHQQGNCRRSVRARFSRVRDRQYRSDQAFQRPATAFRIQSQCTNVGG